MSSIADLHNRMIISKITEDIRKYCVEKPMYPEKQISDAINYIRGEGCVKDFDVTCSEGNITDDGILNVNLDIMLKPETIIQDFK